MSGEKPRPLAPGEAGKTLAARLGRVVDAGRAIDARLGFRPYRTFLVWMKWSGDERGEGNRVVACRSEILPTPKIDDLSGVGKSKAGAGTFGTGSIKVSEISASYTREILMGTVIPDSPESEVPQPYEFFWEVMEDDRHGPARVRHRFSVSAEPAFSAEDSGWTVMLAAQSDPPDADGKPVDGSVPVPVDRLKAVRPEDDF